MKTAKPIFLMQLILLFSFFLSRAQPDVIEVIVNDTLPNGKVVQRAFDKIPLGDIDNDKIADTAYVNRPNYIDLDNLDCANDNCEVVITLSVGKPFGVIHFNNAVDAGVENIGDIDGDGISELIAVPGWFIGCWGQYHFYSFKDGRWQEIGSIHHNLCEEEPYSKSIRKIKGRKITAIEQVWEDGDVVEKTKIIKVK